MELWASVWVCDVCVWKRERKKREGEREREKGIQVTAKVLSVKKTKMEKGAECHPLENVKDVRALKSLFERL